MVFRVKAALAAAVTLMGLSLTSQPIEARVYTVNTPDIYVMMFRADWCAPCKIVEPRLKNVLNGFNDPRIEYVNIDLGNGNGRFNAHQVFDRGLVQQYNTWLGVTGFAAIVDGDTKQTIGCVNMTYDDASMRKHIANLRANAKRNVATFDVTCPAANN